MNGNCFLVLSESLLNFENPTDYFGLRLLFEIELLPVVDYVTTSGNKFCCILFVLGYPF